MALLLLLLSTLDLVRMSLAWWHPLLDLAQLHWRRSLLLRRVVVWITFFIVDSVVSGVFVLDRSRRLFDLDYLRNVRQLGSQYWSASIVDLVHAGWLYLVDSSVSRSCVDETLSMTVASWSSLGGWSIGVASLQVSGRWSHGSIFIPVYLCWPAAPPW